MQNKAQASTDRLWWAPAIVQPERAPLSLFVCAAVIGLLLGLLAPPTEQEGVDGALVLAGIVHYPPQAVMQQYFLGSWTIIHQLAALLLKAGLDQAYVNELLFVVPCMLLVCAYAVIVYCFSGQFLLSLLAAALFLLTNPLGKFFASPDYIPVGLLWSAPPVQTFGFWAHAGSVWVIGCVAAGRKALAGFSALALIAVHPVLGVYMLGLLTVALVLGRFLLGTQLGGFAKGAGYGAIVVALSFAAYLTTRPDLSGAIDPKAYDAYMSFWDTHRSHEMTAAIAARIAIAAAIAIGVLSLFMMRARPRCDVSLLTAGLVMLAVIVSTLAYFAMHLVPDLLPDVFKRAAPGRLLNIQAFLSSPLALGLALHATGQASREWTTETTAWAGRAIPVLALVLVIAALSQSVGSRRHVMADDARVLVATGGLGGGSAQDDDAFWREARKAGLDGLVLTSRASSRPTLYSGHLPVALDVGSFDFIPYIPQTAGGVARIIEQGYGVSFSDPPVEARHGGGLPPDGGKTYWAGLTPDAWCRMSKSLGVGTVVAPNDWTVKLPPLATGARFTIYRIACD